MILMNDFKAEPLELREAMIVAARRVLESGWYVLGNEVIAFEQQWANSCGVQHGIGVANGMDAIEITLRSLGIGKGDEVITTPMTAFATVLAILRAGAIPVLADIEFNSGLLSLESVKRCIGPNTKAIVLVHLYGQVRAITDWVEFCQLTNIFLIEDCAQAHLAASNGKFAGSFGKAGAYSFYPTKNLGAPGDAGMVVTNDTNLAERASRLRNYGQSIRYHHTELGMNSRLDEIQAAFLTERLKWLSIFTSRRRSIAREYRERIANPLINQLAPPEDECSHVYHLFVITTKERNTLQTYLNKFHIETYIHYPIPVHKQEPCLNIKHDPNGLLASEKHAAECLSIPCHPSLTDDDVNEIIAAINKFGL